MASAFWQHPFVNVFKLVNVDSGDDVKFHGPIEREIDRTIARKVLRLKGKVSAANYFMFPKKRSSLGLTGRYCYVQICGDSLQSSVFTIYLQIDVKNSVPLRISLSSLFKKVKASKTTLTIPVPLGSPWTTIVLDLVECCRHCGLEYTTLRQVHVCATVSMRNIYTSDVLYTKNSLPRDMTFALPKGSLYEEQYDWIVVDSASLKEEAGVSVSRCLGNEPDKKEVVSSPETTPIKEDPKVTHPKKTEVSKPKKGKKKGKRIKAKPKVETVVPEPEEIVAPEMIASPETQAVQEVEELFNELLNDIPKNAEGRIFERPQIAPLILREASGFSNVGSPNGALLWVNSGTELAYPCDSTIIIVNPQDDSQRFLMGHKNPIHSIATCRDRPLLVSADYPGNRDIYTKGSRQSVVKLWNVVTGQCFATLSEYISSVVCISLSASGDRLCVVGRESKARLLVVLYDLTTLWDIGPSSHPGKVPQVIDRTISDYPIDKMVFCPSDSNRLVSAGYQTLRFWRLKSGTLRGISAQLAPVWPPENDETQIITDVCFEPKMVGHSGSFKVLCSTSSGFVLQVGTDTRKVEVAYQPHSEAVVCLGICEGFCVTGSSDKRLRIWQVDFCDYFLEAVYESSVQSIDISPDSLHLAVITETGALGVLDIPTHAFKTVLRTHTAPISCIDVDPNHSGCLTCSGDGIIRVWDLDTKEQQYEFSAANDRPTCLAYHPISYVFAAGFASGFLRVFDIASMQVLAEQMQHSSAVTAVRFDSSGKRLVTTAADKSIAFFSVEHEYQPISFLCSAVAPDHPFLDIQDDWVSVVAPDRQSVALLSISAAAHRVTLRLSKNSTAAAAALSEGATIVFVLTTQGRLEKYSRVNGELLASLKLPGELLSGVPILLVSPSYKYVLVTSSSGLCVVPSSANDEESIQQIKIRGTPAPSTILFNHIGNQVVMISSQNSCGIRIYDWYVDDDELDLSAEIERKLALRQRKQKMRELGPDTPELLAEGGAPLDRLPLPTTERIQAALAAAKDAEFRVEDSLVKRLKEAISRALGPEEDIIQEDQALLNQVIDSFDTLSAKFKRRLHQLEGPDSPLLTPEQQ